MLMLILGVFVDFYLMSESGLGLIGLKPKKHCNFNPTNPKILIQTRRCVGHSLRSNDTTIFILCNIKLNKYY